MCFMEILMDVGMLCPPKAMNSLLLQHSNTWNLGIISGFLEFGPDLLLDRRKGGPEKGGPGGEGAHV